MELMLKLNIPKPPVQIGHSDKILSVGSCFTEHIGNALKELKFDVLQNPNGILFDPASVCKSLRTYTGDKPVTENELVYLNELWQNWDFHSRFSAPDKETALANMNDSVKEANRFLKKASWVIITLGSAFSYRLKKDNDLIPVANCHRAPAQTFEKYLMRSGEITELLGQTISRLLQFNSGLQFIFTISPVRHIRDGVIANNRSKARLIEAVHETIASYSNCYYFPAYELVIDVLRDYRFYAEDLVHPNYLATDFVLENFLNSFVKEESRNAITEIRKLNIARKHRAAHPETEAHKKFLRDQFERTKALQKQFPLIDFTEEIKYFAL
jgi:GSCFA family